MRAALILTEDVRVDSEHSPSLVTQVFGDLVDGCPKAQPGGGGVVSQVVPGESEREFPDDANIQLVPLVVGEEVVVLLLPSCVDREYL